MLREYTALVTKDPYSWLTSPTPAEVVVELPFPVKENVTELPLSFSSTLKDSFENSCVSEPDAEPLRSTERYSV